MIDKLNAISSALEKQCYLPALALALTIPDICGEIEHPNFLHKNGNRDVGRQYRTWFNTWVEHHFADASGLDKTGQYALNPYFTGMMCYKLRCAFLHSGIVSPLEQEEKKESEWVYNYVFKLCLNEAEDDYSGWSKPITYAMANGKEHHVRVVVRDLCNFIVQAGYAYYKTKNEADFKRLEIEIEKN